MKKVFIIVCCLVSIICMSSCKENYSNGEKVGNLIEFTRKGVFWDSWEGRLNMTQTGMNTSGETDYFVDDVTVLDKDFANPLRNIGSENRGSVVDTVWVVIDKAEVLRRMKK